MEKYVRYFWFTNLISLFGFGGYGAITGETSIFWAICAIITAILFAISICIGMFKYFKKKYKERENQ